jgi:hypothetical protein
LADPLFAQQTGFSAVHFVPPHETDAATVGTEGEQTFRFDG